MALERELSDARASLDDEISRFASGPDPGAGEGPEDFGWAIADTDGYPGDHPIPDLFDGTGPPPDHPDAARGGEWEQDRTEALVTHGRRDAYHRGLPVKVKAALAVGAVTAAVTALAAGLSGGAASWPASVATVQREVTTACQNPDVKAEPSQINFACAKGTRQVLWVFALLTSGDNPDYQDPNTGRQGLEPITPAQGGVIAWSLNLHQPYHPANPVDSLEVAARAINNIIGGATLTGKNGNPVVEPGLESNPAKCAKYTGSPAVISRDGYPDLCARPVTPAGQAALVADVYRKWVTGASATAAHDAAVLFQNAKNPGNPKVQSILKWLRSSRRAA